MIQLLIAVLVAAQASPTPSVPPPFSIKISTANPVAKVGSEIRIKVAVTNISGDDLVLERVKGTSQGEILSQLEIWDDKGQFAPKTRYGHAVRGESSSPLPEAKQGTSTAPTNTAKPPDEIVVTSGGLLVTLHPGESIQDEIIANKLYDLSNPGRYTLQVQRYDEATKGTVKSNRITITVTP